MPVVRVSPLVTTTAINKEFVALTVLRPSINAFRGTVNQFLLWYLTSPKATKQFNNFSSISSSSHRHHVTPKLHQLSILAMCIGHQNEHLGCGHSFLAFTEMCSVAEAGMECGVWYRQEARLYGGKCEECRKRDGLKRKRDVHCSDQAEEEEKDTKDQNGKRLRLDLSRN